MTALELLKGAHPGAENLVLIIEDSQAQRVAAAWPTLGQRNVDRKLKKNETFIAAAESLWAKAHASFTMDDLANQADVPVTRCERIFFRLVRAGIVYPDGTISKFATDLLSGQVMAHIRGFMGRKKSGRP